MNIGENIRSSIRNVFSNKLRALLTMLGIIIGVAAVIMISSIGAGSTAAITEQLSTLGVGRLTVFLSGSSQDIRDSDRLTVEDAEMLRSHPEIRYITPTFSSWGTSVRLLNPRETSTASITGVTADHKEITSPTLLYGRYITDMDVENRSRVVVINDTTAEAVFGYSGESIIGETISIITWRTTQRYTVVGITENANAEMEAMFGSNQESMIMPITTLMNLLGGRYVDSITIVVEDENNSSAVAEDVVRMLEDSKGNSGVYSVQNMSDIMNTVTSTIGTITLFISAVAAISLVVGGIGVMNIMLVTVTERTREIGIRKSIGAKNKDILIQFMIEAIIITSIGGAIGLALGILGGDAIGSLIDVQAITSIDTILVAVGISMGIGLVFGVYPANKAAKLNPIEALRYE